MGIEIKVIIDKYQKLSSKQKKIINNSIEEISNYRFPIIDKKFRKGYIKSKKISISLNKNSKVEYKVLYAVTNISNHEMHPFPADYYVQNGSEIEKVVENNS